MPDMRTKSAEEIDRILMDAASWEQLSHQELWDLLNISMILYGIRRDSGAIPHIAMLYRKVLQISTPEQRRESCQIVESYILKSETTVVALLPMVVCEPEVGVASSAVLSLISNSTLTEAGVPYGLLELEHLLRNRSVENMGAAFGGLVCFGDAAVRPTLEATKEYLTPEEVSIAAHCATGFVTSEIVDFWLTWAEQLIVDTGAVSDMKLGHIAYAIVHQIRASRDGIIRSVRRHFKANNEEPRVELLKQWTIQEYALEIAPRLYRTEEVETAPKIFPLVLQQLGLEPRSPRSDWARV
jgi:hypothetical protein